MIIWVAYIWYEFYAIGFCCIWDVFENGTLDPNWDTIKVDDFSLLSSTYVVSGISIRVLVNTFSRKDVAYENGITSA